MKRTLKIKQDYIYYGNKRLGYLVPNIQHQFGLERNGKYTVTLVEGTRFRFHRWRRRNIYSLYEKGKWLGIICASRFDRLFFKPNPKKKYDITVKRL